MCDSNWRTETERNSIMRNGKWISMFVLVGLSAAAQTAAPQLTADQPPAITMTAQAAPMLAPTAAPAQMAAPATMDEVINRALIREHALTAMLRTRTPLVETYLQNLKLDRQLLGPVPKEDHYFLGRMDLGESIDRRDYLSKDASFQSHMMGGFNKLFKIEYQP